MAKYEIDRAFTDKMHKVAEDVVYPILKWETIEIDPNVAIYMDDYDAIDYVVQSENGDVLYVQERFRRSQYGKYNDITIRHKREYSRYLTEKLSEFYKIHDKVLKDKEHNFYFLYGISNSEEDNFNKYVIIDLRVLFNLINTEKICIDENKNNRIFSVFKEDILYAGVSKNWDRSSSFITFDVSHLNKFNNLIFYQKGYNI